MQCNHRTLWCAFLLTALVGCAGSESPSPTTQAPSSATSSATEQPAAATTPDTSTPERAVAVFLDAVRRGDDQVASSMFTPLAREKTAELDIQVAPRGSDTAKFDVGEVQYLDEAQTGARVKSAWTDLDPEGKPRTDDIVWMLRRAADGWRVAGRDAAQAGIAPRGNGAAGENGNISRPAEQQCGPSRRLGESRYGACDGRRAGRPDGKFSGIGPSLIPYRPTGYRQFLLSAQQD